MLKGGLSVIKDSIGSQSVKGIALLNALEAESEQWGVWRTANLTLIETYPKACLVVPSFVNWMIELSLAQDLTIEFKREVKTDEKTQAKKQYESFRVIPEDVFDAAVCACLAKAFQSNSPKLARPNSNSPSEFKEEGWVFYPEQRHLDLRAANGHFSETIKDGLRTFDQSLRAFREFMTRPKL